MDCCPGITDWQQRVRVVRNDVPLPTGRSLTLGQRSASNRTESGSDGNEVQQSV